MHEVALASQSSYVPIFEAVLLHDRETNSPLPGLFNGGLAWVLCLRGGARRAGLADGRKPSDSKDYARDERRELLRVAVPVDPLARFSRALRLLLPQ